MAGSPEFATAILKRVADFVLEIPDIVDRPHAIEVKRRLTNQGFSVSTDIAEVQDDVCKVPFMVTLVPLVATNIGGWPFFQNLRH